MNSVGLNDGLKIDCERCCTEAVFLFQDCLLSEIVYAALWLRLV